MSATISTFESEVAVLGCGMIEPEASAEAFERLRADHFSDALLGQIFDHLRERRGLTDPTLLQQKFGHLSAWTDYDCTRLLSDAVADATTWTLAAHVDAIVDGAVRRGLSGVAKDIADRAVKQPGEGGALLVEMEQATAQIARDHVAKPQGIPAGLGALEMLDTAYSGGFAGAAVGLETIDRVTGGIRQDDVWFVGGRTSMGKSVAAICLGRGIAEQGRGVMMFSLEMPMREVQARLIADIAYDRRVPENGQDGGNVRYGDILKGRGSQAQQERARRAAKALASLPFVINDQGGLTIEDIRAQALRQIRSWEKAGVPAGAILIDHIGLVKPVGSKRSDSKAAETADIVNELKGLAKQLRAPIIALTQVNRNTESRNDKRPTLADLNWSGAIEQIADFICLLYRDAYYLERSSDEDDQTAAIRARYDIELLIQKNRSGPICSLKAFADVACNAIRDLDSNDHGRAFG